MRAVHSYQLFALKRWAEQISKFQKRKWQPWDSLRTTKWRRRTKCGVRHLVLRGSLAQWVGAAAPLEKLFQACEAKTRNPGWYTRSNTCVPTSLWLPKKLQSKFRQRLMYHGPNASGCDGIMTCIWEVFGSLKSQPSGTRERAHRRRVKAPGRSAAAQIKLITPAHTHTHTLPLSPSILGKCGCRTTIMVSQPRRARCRPDTKFSAVVRARQERALEFFDGPLPARKFLGCLSSVLSYSWEFNRTSEYALLRAYAVARI